MTLAYLILAHDNPAHLHRLAGALRDDRTRIYVHIDRKSRIGAFEETARQPGTILIPDRVAACWGGFSLVQATLNLLSAAMKDAPAAHWFVLLSGSDYPVRSNAAIHEFLRRSESEHISLMDMPSPDGRKLLSRLETLHFEGARGRAMPKRVLLTQTNRLLERLYKRNYKPALGGMKPYCGSQWWALSREAVDYILGFVETNPRFVRFCKRSLIPDEMFFQTILGNARFKDRIARNLTYADWTKGLSRNPAPMSEDHVAMFADPAFQLDDVEGTGPCFFARKFTDRDAALLDLIDVLRCNDNPL